ncbi:MAG: TIGR03545 family protein [Pseudomonadota bacterium]|nr:TIGR03545 family protein [Pseudomonadota bacterium]
MKLIKRFFLFLLVLILLVVGALWWLPAPLIKWAIEHPGSTAVGAKVDVAAVDFSWFPTSLTLQGLAVTNPRQPMSNAVEFQTIATAVDVLELLSGKVYLEQVLVEGIALDTPRTVSGALPGREASMDEDPGFTLPDLGLPDTADLVAREKALYQQRIDAFNQELDQRQQRWDGILKQLPDEQKLDQYQARWDQAKQGNVLDKLAKGKDIVKDLKRDIDALKSGEKQLKGEYAQLQQDYRRLSQLSDQSVEQIIKELGLSESIVANLGNQLLSGKVQEWLQMGKGYYDLLAGGGAAASADEQQAEGAADQDAPQTAPDFLVKLIRLSGPFVQGGRTGTIDGEIRNLSDAPALWADPVTININALGESLGSIKITGLLAHQKPGAEEDSLALTVKNSRLQALALAEGGSLGMMVNQALLNFDAKASVKALSELNLNLNGVFSQLDLALTEQPQDGWQNTLSQNLSALKELTLNGTAKGPLQNPELKVSTNLNGILKQALAGEIKQQASMLRGKLSTELNQTLQQQMAPVGGEVDALGGMGGEAGSRVSEFESLLKQIR